MVIKFENIKHTHCAADAGEAVPVKPVVPGMAGRLLQTGNKTMGMGIVSFRVLSIRINFL